MRKLGGGRSETFCLSEMRGSVTGYLNELGNGIFGRVK